MDGLSKDEAKRLALRGQGFDRPRPAAPGADDFAWSVGRTKLVQIDSVNVVERAHYLNFFARLGPYDRAALDRWIYDDRQMFEQWAHVASLVPIEQYPWLGHRMATGRSWPLIERVWEEQPEFMESVLAEIRDRGPIVVGELSEGSESTGPWWGWGKGKAALEWHFRRGNLAVRGRRNFARVYDLPERVFAPELLEAEPLPREDAEREMMRAAVDAHGVGTVRDLADYYRLKVADAKARLEELVDGGEVDRVAVEGWKEPGYIATGTTVPDEIQARALLSPFDPVVWERARTERLFDFRYRIEIYTPAPKRVYGYYVFPFLMGTDLVGRVDLKADRQGSALLVRASHIEDGHDESEVAAALSEELDEMARWLGLGRVKVSAKGNLAKALRRARR
jgi:hypothetical protein